MISGFTQSLSQLTQDKDHIVTVIIVSLVCILSDIVKDAWQAAKVVMAEGIKIDLKKELGQAENFSKINDKRRTEPEKKGKSKSGGYKKSNTAVARKTTKKYGR